MSIFDWFKDKIPSTPPAVARKSSTLEQAVLRWDPINPTFNRAAKVPWAHVIAVAATTFYGNDSVPAEWITDGVPVGQLVNRNVLPSSFYMHNPLTIFLRLLSWNEARPLVLDWFSRAVVIAGKENDPEALAMLALLANAKDAKCQCIDLPAWRSCSYTYTIDGMWPAVLSLGQGTSRSINDFGWFATVSNFDWSHRLLPEFFAHGVVRARHSKVEHPWQLVDAELPFVQEGMLGQLCAVLSIVYSHPRIPPCGLWNYESYVQRVRNWVAANEETLAASRNNLLHAEATLADLTKQFATTEPGKTT